MESFVRRLLSILFVFVVAVAYTFPSDVLAQTTTLDPGLYKLTNQKLNDTQRKVDDIRDKTADPGAQDKQIQKVADDVNSEGVKFIEDAGDKAFVGKDHIADAIGSYVNSLMNIFGAKRLCPLLGKLVGPGGKYKDASGYSWDLIREAYEKNCKEKPVPKSGGGIKLGDDHGPCPEGTSLLEDCVNEHNLIVNLYGDGQTTSQCELMVSDGAGHSASKQIPTMCVSKKSLSPPISKEDAAKQNLTYKVATGINPRALSLVNTAKELDKQGKYNDVALNQEKRCSTVTQLSIWKDIGGSTPGNKDAVTHESIKTDLLHKAGVDPKSLTREEKQQLKNRVDAICAAVDLTIKECPEKNEQTQTKEKPAKHSTLPSPSCNDCTSQVLVAYHLYQAPIKLAQVQVAKGKCCIPAGTVFVPSNKEKYQEMMCVEDQVFDCPPGITDGLISDGCKWYFAKQLILPENPHNSRTEGDKYDAFEKEQSDRITNELEKIAEVEAEFIDEDEAAFGDDKFNKSTIVLLYVCVDKSGRPHSAKHKIITKEERKHWDPSGDLDERKKRKDARKDVIDKYRKELLAG